MSIFKRQNIFGTSPLDFKKMNDNFMVIFNKVFGNIDTADIMDKAVTIEKTEPVVQETLGEVKYKVAKGVDFTTEIGLNGEGIKIAIDGVGGASKLKGTTYEFDGEGFKIGSLDPANGDIAEHTPSYSMWQHGDGTYTTISADGLERNMTDIHGITVPYVNEARTGSFTIHDDETKTINFPNYFGRLPSLQLSIAGVGNGSNENINYPLTSFEVSLQSLSNTSFTVLGMLTRINTTSGAIVYGNMNGVIKVEYTLIF